MKVNFTTQERWDTSYDGFVLEAAPAGDPIRTWLERNVPRGQGACLEIGCFPGRYLAVLAEMGYEAHGIDLARRLPELKEWMIGRGHRTGEFVRADAFTHQFGRQFDVVCSFGLIEHFREWPTLLKIHADLVKEGGWLAVSTPNFRGWFQRVMHQWLDRENLAEHNLESMVPREWMDIVRPLGFDPVMCGYIGPFDFWVNPSPNRSILQKIACKVTRRLVPCGRLLPDNIGSYAPYCALVARKRKR